MSDSSMEKTKYNKGIPMDTDDLSVEEWEQCAKEWGEGDKNLENLIFFCLQNGLKTIASCSGHDGLDRPYIAFLNNKKNNGYIDAIATVFRNIKGAGIGFVSNSEFQKQFTAIYLPIRDTSGFCGIKRICQEIQEGKSYEIDKDLVLYREIVGRLEPTKYGSNIQYEFGMPIKRYLDFFKKNPFRNQIGKHIFIRTTDKRFRSLLKRAQLTKNGDREGLYYMEQTDENRSQINAFLVKLLRKLERKDYKINDEELEQIARRPKDISIHHVFERITNGVKTFLRKDKTEENEIGEEK